MIPKLDEEAKRFVRESIRQWLTIRERETNQALTYTGMSDSQALGQFLADMDHSWLLDRLLDGEDAYAKPEDRPNG